MSGGGAIGRRALGLAGLGLLAAPPAARAQAGPRLFGLHVGIDRYPFIRRLQGCGNDARAIAAAVRPVAARPPVMLLDEAATRGAFLRAWDELAREARAGDTLLVSFAGHGGQEPERVRGNEADGLDENLIFFAFHPRRQPNNAERVIDDELGARFAETGRRGVRSIFLADSCHSGTLTRSLDARVDGLGTRWAGLQTIENDMLAGLVVPPAEPAGQPNLLFIAGSQENQLVQEVMIDGQAHGATSHAFARAFARAVAAGRFPSVDAFTRDVVAAARTRVEGRHHPLSENRLPANEPLLRLAGQPAEAAPPAPGPPAPAASGELRIHPIGGGGALAAAARALPDIRLVADPREADLLLDGRGELVSALGDILAKDLDAAALAGAVEKFAALRLLQGRNLPAMEAGLVPRGSTLAPGGANSRDEWHAHGTTLDLVIRPPGPAALAVLAFAADGIVRVLSRPEALGRLSDAEFRMGVRVTPPAGAAHAVAIAAAAPVAGLAEVLAGFDRQRAPLAAARALLGVPGITAVGILGFYVA